MTSLLVLLMAGPSPFKLCPPISMCDDLPGHLRALNSVCFCMLSLPYPAPTARLHAQALGLAMSPHCSINSHCLLVFCKLGASSTRCQKHPGVPIVSTETGCPFFWRKWTNEWQTSMPWVSLFAKCLKHDQLLTQTRLILFLKAAISLADWQLKV